AEASAQGLAAVEAGLERRLAGDVRGKPRLERRAALRASAEARHRDDALADAVEAEPLLDLDRVDGEREVGAEPLLGPDEVQGLAQVCGVHENRRVRLVVLPVLPVVPWEASGHHAADVRRAEVGLTAKELGRERRSRLLLDTVDQLEGVVAAAVVVEPSLDAFDPRDQRVDLHRMEPSTRRARALQTDELVDDRRRTVTAPDVVERDGEL